MPNVVRGRRMTGLMAYLVGPGRANEHTTPHLVAGDGLLMSWYGRDELSGADAQRVARHLDAPARLGQREVAGGHVWHCSLSLAASEGQLSDAQWEQVATDFIAGMGWAGGAPGGAAGTGRGAEQAGPAGGPPAGQGGGLRWVAVRHGTSTAGNDHVHVVVDLVGEDGALAPVWNDFRRAQATCRALEIEHGLARLESAGRGVAGRGWKPAEREAHARRAAVAQAERAFQAGASALGWSQLDAGVRKTAVAHQMQQIGQGLGEQQPRRYLELVVRGAATAARTEGEFVRRLRDGGVLVRPRYAEGDTGQVVGFSVALRPQYGARFGERAVWFGGGRLARDLTLPRLRGGWEATPQDQQVAAEEWSAAARGRRCVVPPTQRRERSRFTAGQAVAHSRRVGQAAGRLAGVSADQAPVWASVAGQVAGTLAAWALSAARQRDPDAAALAPPLAAAAQVLARGAQTVTPSPSSRTLGTTSLTGMALLLSSAVRGGRGPLGQAALLAQVLALVDALAQMAGERQELEYARALGQQAQERLVLVRSTLGEGTARVDSIPGTSTGQQSKTPHSATSSLAERSSAPPSASRPASGAGSPSGVRPARPATRAAAAGERGRPGPAPVEAVNPAVVEALRRMRHEKAQRSGAPSSARGARPGGAGGAQGGSRGGAAAQADSEALAPAAEELARARAQGPTR